MKIAICVETDSLTSPMSNYFGRCNFFAIYETESDQLNFENNKFRFLTENAGKEAMKHLQGLGISRIIATKFGKKAQKEADRFSIQLVIPGDKKMNLKKWMKTFRSQRTNPH